MFDKAVQAVSPAAVMPDAIPLAAGGRTVLVAIGKAAGEMMRVARLRAERPVEGLVVTRYGHLPAGPGDWRGMEIIEAGHPVPDRNSLRGAQRALELAHGLAAGDQMLVLLSGGGSAVAAAPAPGLTLEDKQRVTTALLHSGASIVELNIVRKHLSAFKGGRLALAARGAAVTTWIISDVPGGDFSLVASGPTLADPSTLADARAIVERYAVALPVAVQRALADPANETPERLGLSDAETHLLADGETALGAAARIARSSGRAVTNLGADLQDEARSLGTPHAYLAKALSDEGLPAVVLSGGECRVAAADSRSRGGRNLEYLLGLAIALDGAAGISAIAGDTDGIDGSSDAAGAMIFPDTLRRARTLGLEASDYLASNRSHDFFAAIDDLVVTGPTLTNVGDFRAILVDPKEGA